MEFHAISVLAIVVLSAFDIQDEDSAANDWKTHELDGPTKLQVEVHKDGSGTSVTIQRGPRDAQAPDVSGEELNVCICCNDFKLSTAESDAESQPSDGKSEADEEVGADYD